MIENDRRHLFANRRPGRSRSSARPVHIRHAEDPSNVVEGVLKPYDIPAPYKLGFETGGDFLGTPLATAEEPVVTTVISEAVAHDDELI